MTHRATTMDPAEISRISRQVATHRPERLSLGRYYAVNGGLNGFQRHRGELSGRRLGVLVFGLGSILWIHVPNPFLGRSSTLVVAV